MTVPGRPILELEKACGKKISGNDSEGTIVKRIGTFPRSLFSKNHFNSRTRSDHLPRRIALLINYWVLNDQKSTMICHVRLTELNKQHLGALELTSGWPQKYIFGTKYVQKDQLGLIFGEPGSR